MDEGRGLPLPRLGVDDGDRVAVFVRHEEAAESKGRTAAEAIVVADADSSCCCGGGGVG